MFNYLIENGVRVELSYVLTNELETMICYVIDFDKDSKLLNVETLTGEEYIFPLTIIKQIFIIGKGWRKHH